MPSRRRTSFAGGRPAGPLPTECKIAQPSRARRAAHLIACPARSGGWFVAAVRTSRFRQPAAPTLCCLSHMVCLRDGNRSPEERPILLGPVPQSGPPATSGQRGTRYVAANEPWKAIGATVNARLTSCEMICLSTLARKHLPDLRLTRVEGGRPNLSHLVCSEPVSDLVMHVPACRVRGVWRKIGVQSASRHCWAARRNFARF